MEGMKHMKLKHFFIKTGNAVDILHEPHVLHGKISADNSCLPALPFLVKPVLC